MKRGRTFQQKYNSHLVKVLLKQETYTNMYANQSSTITTKSRIDEV